jgi:hypothetical protein
VAALLRCALIQINLVRSRKLDSGPSYAAASASLDPGLAQLIQVNAAERFSSQSKIAQIVQVPAWTATR